MVKQIRNGELVEKLLDRGDGYFYWLQKKADISGPLSSMLADTVFVSVDGLDDVLMEKAREETRRNYAEDILKGEKGDVSDKDVETVVKSIRGDCCLLEVIYCLSVSLNEMFEDLAAADGPAHFFGILMKNAGLDFHDEEDWDTWPDKVKKYFEDHIRIILERRYEADGKGGLCYCPGTSSDLRCMSLWHQMNEWVDLHTDEDGEWVD